jgi:hypothetical protein
MGPTRIRNVFQEMPNSAPQFHMHEIPWQIDRFNASAIQLTR